MVRIQQKEPASLPAVEDTDLHASPNQRRLRSGRPKRHHEQCGVTWNDLH